MTDATKYDSIPGHIAMNPVESSQIHSIGHDKDANKLYVQFKNYKGEPSSTYSYDNVPAADHAALLGQGVEGHSIGKHFGQNIKASPSKYPFTKLNLEPKEA
jgi:hypothetical protein